MATTKKLVTSIADGILKVEMNHVRGTHSVLLGLISVSASDATIQRFLRDMTTKACLTHADIEVPEHLKRFVPVTDPEVRKRALKITYGHG